MAFYLGIDIGSTTSKCAIVDDGAALIGWSLHRAGAGTQGPETALREALANAGMRSEDIAASCSTGYGRHLLDWTDFQVSELTCHAKGASHAFPGVRTVIDIGGQDAKVLSLDAEGALESFVMNDKCAAGTGRFLDVMASIFGCDVSELSALDERSEHVAQISSTCTVFAESEVISKLAAGTPIPDIVAGVHVSVADRAYGLAKRLGVKPLVAMTGGVARNAALCRRLAEKLGCDIAVSEHSQINGAIGAAMLACEKSSGQKLTGQEQADR